jgi:hypothetical protein
MNTHFRSWCGEIFKFLILGNKLKETRKNKGLDVKWEMELQ